MLIDKLIDIKKNIQESIIHLLIFGLYILLQILLYIFKS